MEFKKWCSITNHYRQKEIAWWLETHPELADETFIICEKLHGSNLSWHFTPNEPIQAASRNNYLDMNGSFQGAVIQELMNNDIVALLAIQKLSDGTGQTIRLFGELIGKGIQKGVKYEDEKQVKYFGMMADDKLLSFSTLEVMLVGDWWKHRLVPIVAKVQGLQAALDFDTKFNSMILNEPDNICEGVVIQPYAKVYYDRHGNSPFLLKKKNDEFKEKAKAKKVHVVDTEADRLQAEFKLYLTDNRLQSVFSKEGEIENPGQIGDYIRWMIADAKVDFMLDFEEVITMNKKQQKAIFNCGKVVVEMLKGYL